MSDRKSADFGMKMFESLLRGMSPVEAFKLARRMEVKAKAIVEDVRAGIREVLPPESWVVVDGVKFHRYGAVRGGAVEDRVRITFVGTQPEDTP